MGKIFAIAKIVNGNNTIGLRIADVEAKKIQYRDVPMASIKKVLECGGATIENVGILDGDVVGTNGSLERLSSVDLNGKLIGRAPLVIINKIGDAGYTIIDYKGTVKKARNEDVVAYAKQFGIANGKVVVKDSIEFISSINGEYDVLEVSASKLGNNKQVAVNLAIHTDTRTLAKHVKAEVADEVDNNDVFKSMTPAQKKAIQDYYMWYTVSIYENMAKGSRFKAKESKVETLAQLRGEDEWEFAGIRDCGFLGASKCELGHPLRYEYYAVARDEEGNEIHRIIFGETCSGDFFQISKEDMAKLVKTRMMMTDEIKMLADITTNHTEKEEWDKLKLLVDVLKKIATKPNTKEVMHRVFGVKTGNTLANFISVNLPFPESLVLLAKEQICKYGIQEFWGEIFPEHADFIREISGQYGKYSRERMADMYLRFMAQVKLGCQFGYDPTHYIRDPETSDLKNLRVGKNDVLGRKFEYPEKKTGGFSKKDAEIRRSILYRFRGYLKCKDFTLEEVEGMLRLLKAYTDGRKIMTKIANEVEEKYSANLKGLLLDEPDDDKLCDIAYGFLANQYRISFDRHYRVRSPYSQCSVSELADIAVRVYTDEFKERMNKIIEPLEEQRKKEEADRLRREEERRLEMEEYNRKLQERAREREEQAKAAAESAKVEEAEGREETQEEQDDEDYKQDRVYKLGELIEKYPNIEETYYIKIAKDILRRKLRFESLSYKQKKMIEKAEVDYFKADGRDIPKEIVNNSYSLDERQDIKEEVETILSYKDDKEMNFKLTAISPKIFNIAESIKKYNKVSDKQYKHIKAGISIINLLRD